MDTFYMILFFLALAGIGTFSVYMLIKHPTTLKKYWKYFAVAAGSLLSILGISWVVGSLGRGSSNTRDTVSERKEKEFRDKILSAETSAASDLAAAYEKEQEVKVILDEIAEVEDEKDRLKLLSDLWNTRRGR